MKNRQRSTGIIKLVGTTLVLAASVGILGWHIYNSLTRKNDDENTGGGDVDKTKEGDHKRRSVCIIVTKTILKPDDIPVTRMLEEGVVFLVAPGMKFYDTSEQLKELDHSVIHRIIHCDTMIGIWICLKSLHPNDLVIALEDFDEKPPNNIQNYALRVYNINSDSRSIQEILGYERA